MVNHDVSVEQWTWARDRYDALRNESQVTGQPFCDQRILRLIETLSSIPGVTTIWSCSGHTKEESPSGDDWTQAYVAFVTRGADSVSVLNAFSEWVMSYQGEWHPRLEMARLLDEESLTDFRPVWTMRLHENNTEEGVLKLQREINRLADILVSTVLAK